MVLPIASPRIRGVPELIHLIDSTGVNREFPPELFIGFLLILTTTKTKQNIPVKLKTKSSLRNPMVTVSRAARAWFLA